MSRFLPTPGGRLAWLAPWAADASIWAMADSWLALIFIMDCDRATCVCPDCMPTMAEAIDAGSMMPFPAATLVDATFADRRRQTDLDSWGSAPLYGAKR